MAKADASGTGAKIDYRARLDDLSEKYSAAEKRLAELKAAGLNKWDTYKGGVETPGASSRRRSRGSRTSRDGDVANGGRMSWRTCLFARPAAASADAR